MPGKRYLHSIYWVKASTQRQLYYPLDILAQKAEIFGVTGTWEKAIGIHRMNLEVSQVAGYEKGIAGSLLKIGELSRYLGRYAEALASLQQSEVLYLRMEDQQGAVMAVGAMGGIYGEQGNYPEAIRCFEQKRDWCLAKGMLAELEQSWGNLGVIYAEQKQLDQALECYEMQLEIADQIGDRQGLSMANGNIGNIYLARGDYEKATRCYNRQIDMAGAIGDKRSLCAVSCNVGLLCKRQGKIVEAVEHFKKAIEAGRQIGYTRVYSLSTGNLGSVYLYQGKWDEARECLNAYLSMSEKTEDALCQVIANANLGTLERLSGDLSRSLEHVIKAVQLVESHHLDNLAPVVLNMAADNLLDSGEPEEAETWARRALEASTKAGDDEQTTRALILSAGARAARGETEGLGILADYADKKMDDELKFSAGVLCYRYGGGEVYLKKARELAVSLFQKTGNIEFKLIVAKMAGKEN